MWACVLLCICITTHKIGALCICNVIILIAHYCDYIILHNYMYLTYTKRKCIQYACIARNRYCAIMLNFNFYDSMTTYGMHAECHWQHSGLPTDSTYVYII